MKDDLNTLYPLVGGEALYVNPSETLMETGKRWSAELGEMYRAVATLTHQVQALQEKLVWVEEEFQQISDWSVATDLQIANLHENQVQYNNALSNVARRDSVSILFSRQAALQDRLSAVEVACVGRVVE
jgi:hypothetical protein